MPHPAGQGLACRLQVLFRHEGVGRGARSAVEVLIAAADREIRRAPVEIDRQRATRMRQVPQHQRAGIMRGAGQFGHVERFARLVMRMGEHQQGNAVVQRLDQLAALCQTALGQALPFHSVDHVEIGGEIAGFAQHHLAPRLHRQRGGDQLEQVHAGGIAGNHLVRAGADQRRDLRPHTCRQIDPAGGVPAADEVAAPFFAHDLFQPCGRRFRQAAERVAVEIDDAIRQHEPVAKFAQRIAGVEETGAFQHHASSLRIARHRPASPPPTLSGRATSS